MKKVTKAVFVYGRSHGSLNARFAGLAYDEHRLESSTRQVVFWNQEAL